MSEFIQVHSCGNQVSAAVDATEWAKMSGISVISFWREIDMVIIHF